MHNSHQSFASRQRMLDHDGNASNQVIWFSDARPEGERPDSRGVRGDRRVDGEHPRAPRAASRGTSRRGHRPLLHHDGRGDRERAGRLGGHPRRRARRPCTQPFPIHSTSRIVAGGPLRGGVYKCALQPVEGARPRPVRRGARAPPSARGWRRSSRPASATTHRPTWDGRSRRRRSGPPRTAPRWTGHRRLRPGAGRRGLRARPVVRRRASLLRAPNQNGAPSEMAKR